MKGFYEMVQTLLETETCLAKRKAKLHEFDVLGNECLYITDFNNKELLLKNGFKNMLGYEDEEMNLDLLAQGYHPNDEKTVSKVIREAVLHTLKYSDQSDENTLSLKYRRKKKDGSYITVLSQSFIFDIDKKGRYLKSVTKLSDITFLHDFNNVSYSFQAPFLNEKEFNEEIYGAYRDLFSNRELEVIDEINKGLSNKKIGQRLFISEHTVATHRKNIFKKAKCKNAVQLIQFCESHSIIKNKVKKELIAMS